MNHLLRRKPSFTVLCVTAILLQVVLLFRAFGPLFTSPGEYLFVEWGDGAKNYFTFQAYLQQPWAEGLAWSSSMNYPFGEYLFYLDNSPLLATGVKVFSHYVYDLTPYGLDVYHGLILAGMLLSTVLLLSLLYQPIKYWGLALIFSVLLPWLSPQLCRLTGGHFNLSLSWVILLSIWVSYQLVIRTKEQRSIRQPVLIATLGFTAAGLIHLYYLPIVGLYLGSFLAVWLYTSGYWRRPKLLGASLLLTVLPISICYIIVRATDGYFRLRLATPTGFNYAPWRLSLEALLQPYPYDKIHFLLEQETPVSYESKMYLGAFVLWGTVLLLLAVVRQKQAWKERWAEWRSKPVFNWFVVGLLAGTVSLLAALGTRYALGNGWYLNNYLGAFFYLQKISGSVAHFRAFARFSWPFFWVVNIGGVLLLDAWLTILRPWWRWGVAIGLVLLAWLDTRDTLKAYRKGLIPNTLTNVSRQGELTRLLQGLNVAQYQAILPIPYFHVGSEDMNLTIDDDNEHSLHSFQLHLRTGLPLMASKLSRTAPVQAQYLESLFEPGQEPAPELLKKLRGHTILVFYDAAAYDGTRNPVALQTHQRPQQLLAAAPDFIVRHHLPLVAQAGKLRLYKWEVQ